MRPLVVTMMTTLDGVVQAPGGSQEDTDGGFAHGGWVAPYFDEALGRQIDEWFGPAEDFLLGRRTYEIFAAYWPVQESDDPVTVGLQTLTKHVASRTLTSLGWDTARLIEGDLAGRVAELKAADGGELQVHGSPGLVQTLLEADLVDELRLTVFPVVVGSGKRLFGSGTVPGAWQLIASSSTPAGVLVCTYRRAGDVRTGEVGVDVG